MIPHPLSYESATDNPILVSETSSLALNTLLHLPTPTEDWRCRHAAMMAISAVGEGCEKQMFPILGEVVGAVLPYVQDQHHRVRYAACNALGQMANDFAPKLQNKFHDKVCAY